MGCYRNAVMDIKVIYSFYIFLKLWDGVKTYE